MQIVNFRSLYFLTKITLSANAYKHDTGNIAILNPMAKLKRSKSRPPRRPALSAGRTDTFQPDFSLSRSETAPASPQSQRQRAKQKASGTRQILSLSKLMTKLIGLTLTKVTRFQFSRGHCQLLTLFLGLGLTSNGPALDSLERLHQMGVLRAAITQPEEVHSANLHPSNILVEALQAFAAEQQVGLDLSTVAQEDSLQNAQLNKYDLLATDQRTHPQLRFTRPVMKIDHLLVHHKTTPKTELPNTARLTNDHPPHKLLQTPNRPLSHRRTGLLGERAQIFELFDQISAKHLPYTLALSHEYEAYRHFVDDLAAEPVGAAHTFRWGFNKIESVALFRTAEDFIQGLHKSGGIQDLKARFFWNDPALNQLERRIFLKRVTSRLPKYMKDFKSAGDKHDLDWRLLAAMAYQESHWNAKAVSPTGVRGLMMLTRAAAKEVGIKNRSHPSSSIHGGAAYFKKQKARLPKFIPEPDRTWMALAAYNMGTRTVLRAIKRTQKEGGNPTDWFNVQEHLSAFEHDIPSRKGVRYRKGADQGIHYVKHIRLFYDLLQHPNLVENNASPTPINLALARNSQP